MDTQDTNENDERRSDDTQDLNSDASVVMDLPDIERDAAGIPTFVFRDQLPEGDRPTTEKKTLEVVLLWREAVMTVGHYSDPREITVGDALKNDFRVSSDSIPVERFPLISDADGQFAINWTGDMALEVKDEDGEILGLEELEAKGKITKDQNDTYASSTYKLGLHERAAVQVGEVTFVLQFVSPARLVTSSILKTIDYYFTKVLSLSFVGHLFLLLALLLTPLEPDGLDEDLFKNPNRFAQLILKEPEKAPENKPKFELSGSKGGAKHKDKEGKFGKPDKEKKDALASSPARVTLQKTVERSALPQSTNV